MKKRLFNVLTAIIVVGLCFSAQVGAQELLGAGATFPYPLYSKMFDAYHKEQGVKINYQAIGSGGGIRQLINKTVDFGGTDAFMSNEKLKELAPIIHIPTCLGAVSVTYNLPAMPELKFAPDVLADIFLGTITKWNDPRLQKINSGIKLPDMKIVVVHRSDGSGTTHIFSDYMSKISQKWSEEVGAGKSLKWPVGMGAKGNPGVSGTISQTEGAIGYVGSEFAFAQKLKTARIKNSSGNFVEMGKWI